VTSAWSGFSSPPHEDSESGAQRSHVAKITLADGRGGRYTRSFQALNGTVYLLGSMKVIEGGEGGRYAMSPIRHGLPVLFTDRG